MEVDFGFFFERLGHNNRGRSRYAKLPGGEGEPCIERCSENGFLKSE